MGMEITAFDDQDLYFSLAGIDPERPLWNGHAVTIYDAPAIQECIASKIEALLLTEDPTTLEYLQWATYLAYRGAPNQSLMEREILAIINTPEGLALRGKDGVIIPAGWCSKTWKWCKKHSKEILIGAAIVTVIGVAIIISVSTTGAGAPAATAAAGAVVGGLAASANDDRRTPRPIYKPSIEYCPPPPPPPIGYSPSYALPPPPITFSPLSPISSPSDRFLLQLETARPNQFPQVPSSSPYSFVPSPNGDTFFPKDPLGINTPQPPIVIHHEITTSPPFIFDPEYGPRKPNSSAPETAPSSSPLGNFFPPGPLPSELAQPFAFTDFRTGEPIIDPDATLPPHPLANFFPPKPLSPDETPPFAFTDFRTGEPIIDPDAAAPPHPLANFFPPKPLSLDEVPPLAFTDYRTGEPIIDPTAPPPAHPMWSFIPPRPPEHPHSLGLTDPRSGKPFIDPTAPLPPDPLHIGESSFAFAVPGKKLTVGKIGMINGIATDYSTEGIYAGNISKLAGGAEIDCIYNQTHSAPVDLAEAIALNYNGYSASADLLIEQWEKFFNDPNVDPNALYLQICHSQGAIIVKIALERAEKDLRDRIVVLAIAPGEIVPDAMCRKSFNFASKRDIVPYGKSIVSGTVPVLKPLYGDAHLSELNLLDPHEDADLLDHAFESPTFNKSKSDVINDFLNGKFL